MITTDLNDMVIFARIVELGGISVAARALGLPKSNVSRRLARLEETLSVRLLERTTRKMHLTEIGQIYFQHCRRILEEAEVAEDFVNQQIEEPRGLLRVSASATAGQYLISPYLSEFMAQHPKVRVDLELSNRRVNIVEEGFDLAIRIGPLEDSSLIAKRIGQTRLYFYASPRYLAKHPEPTQPENLPNHVMLSMNDLEAPNKFKLISGTETKTISIKPQAAINDFSSLLQVVLGGGGIAPLPRYIGKPHANDGKIKCVLPEWSLPPVDLHFLYPSHRGATPKVRAFIEHFSKTIPEALV